jgi:hypothetical protein
MRFLRGGPQRTNTSFVTFTGAGLPSLFGTTGQVSFALKSSYSFAERKALPAINHRYAVDLFDGTARRLTFSAYTTDTRRLVFTFYFGNTWWRYRVPAGQEDVVYGKGVTARFRIAWDGTTASLYVNNVRVAGGPYTARTTWTSAASMTVGAAAPNVSGGGWYSCDDTLSDFEIR